MSLLSRLAVTAARAYGILSSNPNNVSASYLVVAGGASGGYNPGGGGGAGGLLTSTTTLSTLNTYSITVGAGGAANGATGSTQLKGNNGSNSVISGTGLTTITSFGGGYGGGGDTPSGGSGGSGGGNGYPSSGSGGSGTSGQGNAGGNDLVVSSYWAGGGGGGAGAVGGNAVTTGGVGGVGVASSISGSSVYYAGGGGGSGDTRGAAGGAGGNGGGGLGGGNGTTSVAGTANTGGGGGGGSYLNAVSAAGGSGIVIISYTSATPKFVGGTITTSGGKQIHTFTSSGTLSPITPITASYLVVAGGGGAVGNRSGGGGAGGLLTSSTTLYSGATYIVTVGAGGAGGAGTAGVSSTQDGSNSVLSGTGLTTLTAIGGGGGAGTNNPSSGRSGGSGGGGGGDNATGATGGAGTSGQGFAGGTPATGGGAGGGGASAVGSNGTSNTGANGGAGTASSITGTSVTYAGGGGGGGTTTAGTGGAGGGGNGAGGSPTTQLAGVSGTQNLGGGAGGGSNYGTTPVTQASGGSGIVIISYAGSQAFNGGLVTSSGGNTIHTFTSTGALTPLTNNLNNSLRFRSSASAYLSRTFATTGTSRTTFTFSCWIKRGALGSAQRIMDCYDGSSGSSTVLLFDAGDTLSFQFGNGSSAQLTTTQVFRDPAAWYHIVVKVDTTQATAANRGSIYINGNQVTAFSTATYPTQNLSCDWMYNSANNRIMAQWSGGSAYTDGYLADVNFIDGQALEPYYFGNNDANGVWKPILYKGTYGTNGFYLTFGNTTSTTTLGYDSSPNGNNWTTNNISLTAGTTYDAMTDVPTNTSATVANYATLNPVNQSSNLVTTGGNLNVTSSTAAWYPTSSTISIPTSGKWYCEFVINAIGNSPSIGIWKVSDFNFNSTTIVGYSATSYSLNTFNGNKANNSSSVSYGSSLTNGDILNIAVDMDSGKIWWGKNGTWFASGSPASGTNEAYSGLSGEYYISASIYSGISVSANFGQRPFAYTPPTGFVALNTFNLPTPTILQGNKYMDAYLRTGGGGTVTVNGINFYPDLVWSKGRSVAYSHHLNDSNRGANKDLSSNSTGAETSSSANGYLSAFASAGYTLSAGSSDNNNFNQASATYVDWLWNAGAGTNTSNTSGTITSTVSVNTTAGFSVVTYTGTGAGTVGHGLGIAPAMVIIKNRSRSAGSDWAVYHKSLSSGNYILLNSTAAQTSASAALVFGNGTSTVNPSSTVISVGGGYYVSIASDTYVAYCWAEIAGFSKFGSYTGNGSTDGPFVFTNFRPKFVMIKRTDADSGTYAWLIYDSVRDTYNYATKQLFANISNAEATGTTPFMFLSNGFKITNTGSEYNANGGTYIYMTFAENPLKLANAR